MRKSFPLVKVRKNKCTMEPPIANISITPLESNPTILLISHHINEHVRWPIEIRSFWSHWTPNGISINTCRSNDILFHSLSLSIPNHSQESPCLLPLLYYYRCVKSIRFFLPRLIHSISFFASKNMKIERYFYLIGFEQKKKKPRIFSMEFYRPERPFI